MHSVSSLSLSDLSPATLGVTFVLCSVIMYATIAKMFGLGSKNEFEVDNRTVVITGGSDGMGKSVACQLAAKGANVVIVARTTSKLESALETIKGSAAHPSRQRFHYISADLTKATDCKRIIDEVTEWNGDAPPDVVWCCAGYCNPGFFVDTEVDTLRDQMDTVYWTAANTAHATLRKWLSPLPANDQPVKPRRHLIFTCSTLAFVPVAGYGPYSPAKAAIRSLSDTLNQEIEMYNGARTRKHEAPAADVKVHTVFPMGILSPGFDNEEKIKPELTKQLEEADKPQTPDDVASITIKALEHGDYLITTMFVGHIMRGAALGVSTRNYTIRDTLMGWLSNLVFLVVTPDLHKKAWNWGVKNGTPKPTSS